MSSLSSYQGEIEAIFGHLTEDNRKEFSIVNYAAGTALMEENALDDLSFFYILSGVAEGKKVLADESTCNVPIKIEKGDFVGLYEALHGGPKRRTLGIYAKSDVKALKITQAQLHHWIQKDPAVMTNIVIRVLSMSWKQRESLLSANIHSLHIRLAYLLRNLYHIYLRSCYEEGYTGGVRILDTRQELSAGIGCSVRTVDRIVSGYKDKGLISIRRGKIYINHAQSVAISNYIMTGI